MPSLFVIQGRDQGKRFEIDQDVVGVGRDRCNAVQLHDTEVSRQHAELRLQDDRLVLVDLESSNGTYVNTSRIDSHDLRSGDRITIGRTRMIFTAAEEPPHSAGPNVDIVAQSASSGGSRIVKSISQQDGSQIFRPPDPSDSPWLARARSNLQVMYRTALAVSHTLDIDQLLQRIMELIFEWVETDRGCIMLVDQETDELALSVSRHRQGLESDDKLVISRTILDYVMQHNEGVLTSDAREDERWDPAVSILTMGVREAICVPMQGRYGVVGVIYIDTYTPPGQNVTRGHANKFSEEHLKLMIAIGHQAALAVEDTSYYSAMVQAERLAAMGQTIATLSHHIKNILQGIRGGSYLIQEGLKGEEWQTVQRGWGIVERNQDKISNLVMDMLSFSKEREPELQPADLNEVAHDVVELMRSGAEQHGVSLHWEPQSDLPQLTFDPEALHRAVLNVVTNAIDACDKVDSPRVTVSTSHDRQGEMARVAVQDNGEGVPASEVRRIFSPFNSKKGSRGTGLGLPVSLKILREHHGDIRVESEEGQGSRFVLEFPAVVVDDPDAQADSDSQVGRKTGLFPG